MDAKAMISWSSLAKVSTDNFSLRQLIVSVNRSLLFLLWWQKLYGLTPSDERPI